MKTEIKNTRLLAAVMFIDIVGYTKMMQENEKKAIRLRNYKRKALEIHVARHQGTIVQYYGDGALSMFRSAFNAVLCAINIQRQLRRQSVPVRIGIHSGDIVYNSDGVYGNAVNVASRIESLSLPGGILISDKVYDEIKNHAEIKTASVGTYGLKHVDRSVKIYAVKNQAVVSSAGINKRWDKILSKRIEMELIQPVLSNINAGLLN